MAVHHSNLPEVCPACELKLLEAHPVLRSWFRSHVKNRHPRIHVSWSFRDEANQNECVRRGLSKLHWPRSAHNQHLLDTLTQKIKPCAQALDLFYLSDHGVAQWPGPKAPDIEAEFKMISQELVTDHIPVFRGSDRWGWDGDHFQMEAFDTKLR